MANKDSEFFLEDEETVENNLIFRINIIGDLLLLREVFKTKIATNFMTVVIKIALNLTESKIASCIVAYYKAKLSENMIDRALKTDQMDFIYTVWSYHKNYSSFSRSEMTFEYLFKRITLL